MLRSAQVLDRSGKQGHTLILTSDRFFQSAQATLSSSWLNVKLEKKKARDQ
jgi:hypothetical protein